MKSTERFSSRVENYVKYRPTYPAAVLDLLRTECGQNETSVVADIGSGTGISTALLLQSGATVYGVEPNKEMRLAAETLLGEASRSGAFHSVYATAEATTLADHNVDLIIAGQAFHWFDWDLAGTEFRRILKPEGWVTLMWNERICSGSEFLDGYEEILLGLPSDYQSVRHDQFDAARLSTFFRDMKVARFPNSQSFDLEGASGRLMSSSYAPEQGSPEHGPMIAALTRLFEETQVGGSVEFLYETQVYYGRM